jgi:hypothetical protein
MHNVRRIITASLFTLALLAVSRPGAAQTTLYDNFSSPLIDPSKWLGLQYYMEDTRKEGVARGNISQARPIGMWSASCGVGVSRRTDSRSRATTPSVLLRYTQRPTTHHVPW